MTTRILEGQTAVVTGANSGIGHGVALSLAKAGANVAINWVVGEEAAHDVVQEVESYGVKAFAVQADVGEEDQVKTMFKKIIDYFGFIDILVNNGRFNNVMQKITEMTLAQWQKVIDVNLTGQFLCSREATKEFIKRGNVRERSKALGKIICMSSVHDTIPWAGHCNYAASKGGVMLLMKSLAQELAPMKIRVNAISPGAIKTPINKPAWESPEAEANLLSLIPYQRVGDATDIGRTAVWLASDDSDYINGTTIYVDGGMTCYPGFATGG